MKKKRVIPIKKDVSVTKAEIINTFRSPSFDGAISSSGASYAIIGGALLKMIGYEGYETQDIDVASDMFLEWDDFFTTKGKNSTPGAGHYLVNDTPVEWMVEGKPGSDRLFSAAVHHAYLSEEGLWLAPLEISVAIMLYAGREKDKETFRELWDNGVVNGQLVIDLVKHYTGTTPKI
jgi:hypothetical protein